ncbi:GNAT family N-acetyltransferase [Flavihumibacter rivuli]|uniref:GNAT family N-acetyltransferase n=1 Tax=Flavihumibacter rivuli TaxID=2838156 RepID=UPI001BDE5629|nr:GNAT family N-acetyltransferase [Flavihumibacter rivuli]ULQ56963.1 GNAT family N-acetyltransferase [Flavihumibacter rivuli]
MVFFETERLRLRQLELTDTAFIVQLLNSPGWLQFIGDRNVRTEEEAEAYIKNGPMKSYAQNNFGLSLVERKEDDSPVGMCGIIWRQELEHPDIGFALLPEYYGNGYAYEIAVATKDYARGSLGLSTIAGITLEANTRSIRLLEKLGLSFQKKICLNGSTEELLLYSN